MGWWVVDWSCSCMCGGPSTSWHGQLHSFHNASCFTCAPLPLPALPQLHVLPGAQAGAAAAACHAAGQRAHSLCQPGGCSGLAGRHRVVSTAVQPWRLLGGPGPSVSQEAAPVTAGGLDTVHLFQPNQLYWHWGQGYSCSCKLKLCADDSCRICQGQCCFVVWSKHLGVLRVAICCYSDW